MNVMVLGSGGREHAICDALSKSKYVSLIFAVPGNPGMADIAKCIDVDPMNNKLLKKLCNDFDITLVIPGSEVFLENGVANELKSSKIKVFGPTKEAAQIESSKEFAKDLMEKYNIPTAHYKTFGDYDKAKEYVLKQGTPIVIKYDGLAGGKGVVVAMTLEEALDSLDIMLNQRVYGNANVIIEEYLEGPEFSLMCFVHNNTVYKMPIAQDHKRLLDNDQGPNTGGMGVYSSVPIISDEVVDQSMHTIMKQIASAMVDENVPFTGFLYGGLMLTTNGPKVIEFNARFGDPETEVILPKLKTDIIEIILNIMEEKDMIIEWDNEYYVGVVMASNGYPLDYKKGYKISGLEDVEDMVYHMGTKICNGDLVTNGGRVLLVTGKGDTLEVAKREAYQNVQKIKCDNLIYRTDIAMKSIKR